MTGPGDLRAIEAPGSGAWRWGLAASVVAAAYGALVWLAFAMPPPEGTLGEINEAVMIELEPVTAEVEAPPPAPEPVVEEPPPPEVTPPPEPPVVPEPPPEPEVLPEPIPEPPVTPLPPEPPLPEPEIVEPVPEPEEIVPDLPEVETQAEAILNAPIPMARPTPPRPQPVRKEVRKPPPPKKVVAEKPARRKVTRETPRRASATQRSDTAPARNAAAAPRVSPASWQRQAVSHFRKFRRKVAVSTRGVARVAVTIDRGGRVLSARLAGSSGNGAFDSEAIALVRRASPIPAPPEGVGGRTVSLVVPVNM
jgi:protein TonB